MRGDNSDSRPIIDWSLPPELQAKYDLVVAETRRLQVEMGVKSMTLQERAESYQKRKDEETRLKSVLGTRRPPPKWKV